MAAHGVKSKGDDSPALPIAAHRAEIIAALSAPVLVLSGETGSGKSTQVPQYLLDAPWHKKGLRIGITQPRRVAAISLARRVASELGTGVGKQHGSRVGYSVRFDSNVQWSNEVVYLTEGMLLVELVSDPGLCSYEVVVVDEVHERSVNVDLLLGFLRDLVSGKGKGVSARKAKGLPPLRVAVMSATADVQTLADYFNAGLASSKLSKKLASTVAVAGRQHPVQINYLPQPTNDWQESALVNVFQTHRKEPLPGDILVFMTGQETIQGLQKYIEEYAQKLGREVPKMLVRPIYAALPQAAQQLVFEPAPRNTRKIILATNIAETSITIPGVRYVIDCGKEKRKHFRPQLGLESLLVKSISKSSAIQRSGRAGREAPGKCWRLYTQAGFDGLEQATAPEIVRCDLADSILKMKSSGIDDVMGFPLLTPPSREAFARALLQLYELKALDDEGKINEVGRKLSRFPLTPAYGRVLLAASEAEFDCLLPVIDIVACFSADNTVFFSTDTDESREEATTSRAALLRRQGDHMTLLAVVQSYIAENADRKAWCKARLINHRAMQNIVDIRKQLRAQCITMELLTSEQVADYDSNGVGEWASDQAAAKVLQSFLRGFKTKVALLVPDGSYRTLRGRHLVSVHPSSVLFGKKRAEAILYNEFVFTNKPYARGVSAVQMDWVHDVIDA